MSFSVSLRARVSAAVAVLAVVVGVIPTAPSAAAGATTRRPTPSPALTYTATTARTAHGVVRVRLLRIRLGGAYTVQAVAAHNQIGAEHQTVGALARQTHAIAGINGDFWPWSRDWMTAAPSHGVITPHNLLKTPGVTPTANFFITTDGLAHIGNKAYSLTYTWQDGTHQRGDRVLSVNNLRDAEGGHNVWLTPSLVGNPALPDCPLAMLARDGGGWQVKWVTSTLSRLPRLRLDQRAVLSCRAFRPHVGDVLQFTATPAGRPVQTLLSGGAELVRQGVAYRDANAQLIDYKPQAQTFACVGRNPRNVLLGTAERFMSVPRHSKDRPSPGVTTRELQAYVTKQLHCWSALAFDGGGSTTMIYQGVLRNRPTYGPQRPVADGLFVYRRH